MEGNERLPKEVILSLSGVDIHANLLALDLEQVEKNILAHPWIDRVTLKREWPNRLLVRIHERRPVVLLNTREGLKYVDRRGKIFAAVTPGSELDFPVITGLEELDEKSAEDDPRIREVIGFVRHAARGSSSLPKQNLSEFHFSQDGEIELFLSDRPFSIFLGKTVDRTSYYRLAKVLYWLYKKREFDNVAYIRLDYMENKVLVGKE